LSTHRRTIRYRARRRDFERFIAAATATTAIEQRDVKPDSIDRAADEAAWRRVWGLA